MELLIIFVLFPFLISFYNLLTNPSIKTKLIPKNFKTPSISIVVPMRNESINVEGCLESLLDIDYPNFKIIAINDNSTDDTLKKLNRFKEKIKIVNAKEKPDGWIGKNWACFCANKYIDTDYVLFTDADVRFNKYILQSSIAYILKSDLDLLSLFPFQYSKNIFTKLNIMNIVWFMSVLLPINFISYFKNPAFSSAIGQFLMFKTESYMKFGGHERIKETNIEDLMFAYLFKKEGFKISSIFANDLLICNMYPTFKESLDGISRSFYTTLVKNPIVLASTFLFLILYTTLPFVLTIVDIKYLFLIILSFFTYLNVNILAGQNILYTFLYPIQGLLFLSTGIYSLIKYRKERVKWREREI